MKNIIICVTSIICKQFLHILKYNIIILIQSLKYKLINNLFLHKNNTCEYFEADVWYH